MRSNTKDSIALGILVGVLIIFFAVLIGMLAKHGSNDLDNTCPSYGEVPVVVDGGETLCVPWEKVADFDQFKEEE